MWGRRGGRSLLGDAHVLVEVLGDVAHILLDLVDDMSLIHHMELSVRTRHQRYMSHKDTQREIAEIQIKQRYSSNRDTRDTCAIKIPETQIKQRYQRYNSNIEIQIKWRY